MKIGLQLYTVRTMTANDMIGTLEKLAEAGYDTVETAGYGNSNPRDIRAALDRLGMSAVGAHVALSRIENEFNTVAQEMQELGCRHLIVPWLPPEERGPDGINHLIAVLNDVAPKSAASGLRLGYHNHEFEFDNVNGETVFDHIAQSTDPSLVSLEIDVGWVAFAGHDPVELIQNYAGRVPLIHAKEMQGGESADLPAPGSGPLPWREIVNAAAAAGTECMVVEDDQPSDPLRTAREGLANMQRLIAETA
jgi:sugar phosphate isomerase/epimerase